MHMPCVRVLYSLSIENFNSKGYFDDRAKNTNSADRTQNHICPGQCKSDRQRPFHSAPVP